MHFQPNLLLRLTKYCNHMRRLEMHHIQSSSFLPFCKNWKIAVATSTFSGFLSGCQARSKARNSFERCYLDSICLRPKSLFNTSRLVVATSADSATSAPELEAASFAAGLLPLLRLVLLLDEDLRLLRFRFFFFFGPATAGR